MLRVEGGWSAVIQVPSIGSEESLVLDILTSAGVLVHPGFFFDFSREAFVVVSLLVEPGVFASAIEACASAGDARGARMIRRESGLNVPLFSLVSSRGWGIGEFADLARFAAMGG